LPRGSMPVRADPFGPIRVFGMGLPLPSAFAACDADGSI
jgi:hypothetical protein